MSDKISTTIIIGDSRRMEEIKDKIAKNER